jgi:hypothetical protein
MRRKLFLPGALVFILGTGCAQAATITYTESVSATGSLGGNPFTNALVILTLTADTADVFAQIPGLFFGVSGTLVTLQAGAMTASFTDAVAAYVFTVLDTAGLTSGSPMLSLTNAAFTSYALATSLGPVTGPGTITEDEPFGTSAGDFILNSIGSDVTFTATVVSTPEPVAILLMGSGLLGGQAIRRYRFSSSALRRARP